MSDRTPGSNGVVFLQSQDVADATHRIPEKGGCRGQLFDELAGMGISKGSSKGQSTSSSARSLANQHLPALGQERRCVYRGKE
jgi:hypothetical protein